MNAVGIVFLFLLFFLPPLYAQEHYRAVFYNTENLFDTVDDPLTDDNEFTPSGSKRWTSVRYNAKLENIARTLADVGGGSLPAFIGLAEIENRRVITGLLEKSPLKGGHYRIVHKESPDTRGIDVAFLYRENDFRPLVTDFIKVSSTGGAPVLKTRDILYVSGITGGKDTLHFFVCHFPSMREGEAKTEWKRVIAATELKKRINTIRSKNPAAYIIVMGDLNGKAGSQAQAGVLGAGDPQGKIKADSLYNTGYYLLKADYGSSMYRGKWQTLDQIIVSGSLLGAKSALRSGRTNIFSAPYLLEKDKKSQADKPKPTYRGPIYTGGSGDHLPVYIDLYGK